MKRFQVITAIMFFLGVAITGAQAQNSEHGKGGKGAPDPKKRAAETVAKLKDGGLTLDDATWTKVQATYEESFTKAEASRTEGTKPDREQMQKEREATQAKLKTLMTEDQYKKLLEIEKSMGPGGGKGGQHKKPNE